MQQFRKTMMFSFCQVCMFDLSLFESIVRLNILGEYFLGLKITVRVYFTNNDIIQESKIRLKRYIDAYYKINV